MTIQLRPTVYITGGEDGLLHRAQLHLTGGDPGQAVFHAALDGETRETVLTVTDGETTALVDIPCREMDATLCWRLTDAAGQTATGELLWKAQKRWEVHFIPITHHDLGYTQPIEPLFDSYCHYYDRVLDFCDQTADYPPEAQYRYTVEELWSLEEYLRRAPEEKREKLLRYVREGRIEISALYANIIDSICDEEELIRLLYPAAQLRERYDIPVDTASLVDMPGLSWGMIRALSSAGIRYLFAGFPKYFEWGDTRGEIPPMEHSFWDEKALLPNGRPQAFRWRSQDGGEVLTWYQAGYGWFGDDTIPCLETDTYDVVAEHLPVFLQGLEEKGCPYSVMRYIDHGSDNQVPQKVIADIVREWNGRYAYPKLKVSTNRGFFESLEAQCVTAPELCAELPHTDYTMLSLTEAEETTANARNHTTLRQAESLRTMVASLQGEKTPAPVFTDIYRDVLLYDEHCFGMGLPLGSPHAYSWSSKQHYIRRAAYRIEQQLGAAQVDCLNALDLEPGQYLTVYYPAPRAQAHTLWVWGEGLPEHFVLEDRESGALLPVQQETIDAPDLPLEEASARYAFGVMGGRMAGYGCRHLLSLPPMPAVGYKTYRVKPLEKPAEVPAKPQPNTLENAYVKVTVDATRGCIVSIWDKRRGKELVDTESPYGCGSLLCRNIETDALDTALQDVQVSVHKQGDLAESLVIRGRLTGCPEVVQEITLYKDRADVEIACRILKDATPFQEVFAAFPFAGKATHFRYRGTAGEVEAFKEQLPGSNTHQHTAQGWAQVLTADGGVTVTSPEARVLECGALRPTAVSQAHHGIHPKGFTDAYARDGGEKAHLFWMLTYNNCQTNFSTTQVGDILYRFTIHPDPPEAGLPPVAWGYGKGEGGGALPANEHWLCWENSAVELQCCKMAEFGAGLILRFTNPVDTPQPLHMRLPEGYTHVRLCDACERPQTALSIVDDRLELTLKGHELVTLLLD